MWESKTEHFNPEQMLHLEMSGAAELAPMMINEPSETVVRACIELFLNGGQGKLLELLTSEAVGAPTRMLITYAAERQRETNDGHGAAQIRAWLAQRQPSLSWT